MHNDTNAESFIQMMFASMHEYYANTNNDVHKWGRPQINQAEKLRTSRVGASKPSHQKWDFESTILRDQ